MFTEILRIEEAYDKLQSELKKVKSFLPQSVLKQLEQQDNGDDDDDDDEGNIAEGGGSTTEHSTSRGPGGHASPKLHRRISSLQNDSFSSGSDTKIQCNH